MQTLNARILYIEDDPDSRELVSFVLSSYGYRVVATENPDHAVRLASSECFDLYLIDNWMPGCSGVQLCQKLRQFDSKTPILFYSGAAFETDREVAFSSGAQGYLTKPVDNHELVHEVSHLISRYPAHATITDDSIAGAEDQLAPFV